jgi:hypothetical protein
MKNRLLSVVVVLISVAMSEGVMAEERGFAEDVEFLKRHVETIVLGEAGGPQVAVVPAYQGRVMTSTVGVPGNDESAAPSFGWINYELIESGKQVPHIHVFGGEERFWLGPEGGQYSIFFPPGGKFELADWQTPAVIDTEPFEVVTKGDRGVRFRHVAKLMNYSRAEFELEITRDVELLPQDLTATSLGVDLEGVAFVGYRSTNSVKNVGSKAWRKETGLLSIWMLGMYKPGERTTVVIPFHTGSEEKLGPVVNDAYFGKPPAERLVIGDGELFFSGDGKFRSKIGLSPRRAKYACGSWDAEAGVLTIVRYSKPESATNGAPNDYVNSMWEIQKEPYSGDVVNSYNDGPATPGAKPLGPFYELETSSPALALEPGATGVHVQETYHLEGERAKLDAVARHVLGASLEEIEGALESMANSERPAR